jgi:hypothetical protein
VTLLRAHVGSDQPNQESLRAAGRWVSVFARLPFQTFVAPMSALARRPARSICDAGLRSISSDAASFAGCNRRRPDPRGS